jgi:toxin FitB
MKGWLLDTNVLSELRKPTCHPAVKDWSDRQLPQSLYLSTIVFAEIRYGIDKTNNFELRQELIIWLDQVLRPWFGDRVLPVDEEVILCWRKITEAGRKRGYTFGQPDALIAATAMVHDLCVVTRNIKDFEQAEVQVLNPWKMQVEN